MNNDQQYSKHLETIIALVTNLGLTRYKSRTPSRLAKYLSLDEGEVEYVLHNFKRLFRESITPSNEGEYFYTLQLRYAIRWREDEDVQEEIGSDDQREPLEADYLSTLLGFISDIVGNEQAANRQGSANRSAIMGACIAAGAAIIIAIISLIFALPK